MKPPHFKARARLLNQLGDQLIKNESIALLELIKNSYDADASYCLIQMKDISSPTNGEIVILDDGCGMDYSTLENVWLEIGTSNKEATNGSPKKRTPAFNRFPLGEKGIGRLGAHRLGREIEVISRTKDGEECRLFINWDEINSSRYVEDLPILLEKRRPQTFQNNFGTQITIRRLRGDWSRGMVRDCARAITSLNSPFEEKGAFRAELSLPNSDWLDSILKFPEIEQYKLFTFEATLFKNEITDFKYSFAPYPTMQKLSPRNLGMEEIRNFTKMVRHDGKTEIILDPDAVGPIRFKGIIFDLSAKVLSVGVQDKKGLRDYLSDNGGIRVFRENMRIWDYGEKENDWLDLDEKRVNNPSFKLSNKLLLGAVYLDGSKSAGLVEKANREGFVSNQHYQEFKAACSFLLERVEFLREKDKDLLRTYYGVSAKSEPVLSTLAEVKTVVEKHVKGQNARDEINRYLIRIQDDYEKITESLIKSAGAGLNLIVVIHQVQKIIKNILSGIRNKISLERLEEQVKMLAALVEGYSILVKSSNIKSRSINSLIENAVFNTSFRLRDHGITLNPAFRQNSSALEAIFSESHAMNALMNLFDNSIWWLGYASTKNPSIFIDVSDALAGFRTIVFADNGPGFALPTEELCKPFISAKPGGTGIGLHLTQEIMRALKGKLIFPELGEFQIPVEYRRGALIALAFRKDT